VISAIRSANSAHAYAIVILELIDH